MINFILIFLFFFSISMIKKIFLKNYKKNFGDKFEKEIVNILTKNLSKIIYLKNEYYYLNKFSNNTNEIDIIAVNKYGVFIIECKNWFGEIYIDSNKKNCIKINNGYINSKLINPIFQNNIKVKSIKELLKNEINEKNIYSIIIFPNNSSINIDNKMNSIICKKENLKNIILNIEKENKNTIKKEILRNIVNIIKNNEQKMSIIKKNQHNKKVSLYKT